MVRRELMYSVGIAWMAAICLAVELSDEQHEKLPDFGDPQVNAVQKYVHGYIHTYMITYV